jgi:hypothetical protein
MVGCSVHYISLHGGVGHQSATPCVISTWDLLVIDCAGQYPVYTNMTADGTVPADPTEVYICVFCPKVGLGLR